ncbi:uncharacterized protein LOC122681793 isoform X3 [Cervus elaphus]|uniref:uncharacterized protein LOC122448613 isoform X3 n=1 Tax=Cervus canadensis TaxID=1574408 RepID=UPI001C9E9AD1|nr:uncharacterized protein LOC122448613 isoform X3 [Cervus canadensis]XP_043740169.1 uncharacterized protein LOC122681793 isoform X3 [Cervus elaphus]
MLEEVANLKGSWGALPQGPKKPVWIGERGTLYAPKMRYRIAAVSVLQLCLQAAAQKARDLSSQDVPSVTIRPAAPKGWRCRDTTTSAPPTLVVRRAPPETPVPPLPALQAQETLQGSFLCLPAPPTLDTSWTCSGPVALWSQAFFFQCP